MTHPKWKNSVCYILWKFYTSKVLYICCYLGWHVCRDWQNKFSVGMTELQTKPQNFQTLSLLLEGEWREKKKRMFFCPVEMLPDWAICKEDTLQFCLIHNRRGAYLWRGAFLHNTANRMQTCLCAKTFPRLLMKGLESSTPCMTPAPPPCILSCQTLP